jgi:hypothetical protein
VSTCADSRRKDILFDKWLKWENWISTWKRLKLVPDFSPCTKINSKWLEGLVVLLLAAMTAHAFGLASLITLRMA